MTIIPVDSQIETTPLEKLTDEERVELAACESKIEDGLEGLWHIKTQGLFREYGTFADYMQQRWGRTRRSGDFDVAAYTAILLLRDSLAGTDVPIPTTEYTIRPIASLPPEKMIEIYNTAIEISQGKMPTHDIIVQAKEEVLGEKERKLRSARLQIEASPYDHLKDKLDAGEDPLQLEALMDTLNSADPYVREKMIAGDIKDRTLIKRLSELYVQRRDTAEEILLTGYLQFADGNAIKLREATAKDLQRLLNEKYREHLARAREEAAAKSQAVSTLVYNGDSYRTLQALKDVLNYTTLIGLANLIGEM